MGKMSSGHALLLAALLGLPLAAPARPPIAQTLGTDARRQLEREARLVVDLMQNCHESGRLFRDIPSTEILLRYINELDRDADYFTADDVDFIQRRFARTLKSVYLFKGDLQPAFEIFDLYAQRVAERTAWIEKRLAQPLDLTAPDTLALAPDSPPANQAAADLRWEQNLKDQLISEMLDGRTPADAVAEVARRHVKYRRRVDSMDTLAVREFFFDGLLRSFDPHSGYFSADSTKEFSIEMHGEMPGAGLSLRKDNGTCLVAAVEPGGPADLNTDLRPGDIIEAYADGDAPLIPAKGRRLRDIIATLRGKAGAKLRLSCRHPADTAPREITLERALVVSLENRARGAIFELPAPPAPGGRPARVGWIDLPTFYATHDDPAAPSATRDITELLARMRDAPGIDALVLDLRDNGGGALSEALALSGLFVPQGNVMLSRAHGGKITEHPLKPSAAPYPGPLVILTSARSASASEIFAGAMKYHRRALIAGDTATFGKGTMQNYIELVQALRVPAGDTTDWGTLRLTSERFYLPDGNAIQRRGIPSDIVLPHITRPGSYREETMPHALPADPVTPPAAAAPATGLPCAVNDTLLAALRAAAEKNIAELPEWKLLQARAELRKKDDDAKTRPLVLEERRAAWQRNRAALETLRAQRRSLENTHAFPFHPVEIPAVQSALDAHRARLATLTAPDGTPLLHRLHADALLIRTDLGHPRRLHLEDFDYDRFSGDTETLATAISTASGLPATPAEVAVLLQSLSRLEHLTEATALACFASAHAASNPDPTALKKGLEALLLRMTELESDYRRHHAALDVPLREALRLAAAWARQQTETNP